MPTPPIIIKKKISHGGHHGGAWKVAYADFVTAMMALFIVLWLLNTNKPVREAVAGYFKDPSGTATKIGTNQVGTGESVLLKKEDMADLKKHLEKKIESMIDMQKLNKNIEMTITAEGLRIELLESDKGTFFDSGSPNLKPNGQEILGMLAVQLGEVPNHLSIEGHTDAKPYGARGSYSNWELSADRANAARRLMQQSGLRSDQVAQVRGFADQRLRNRKDPLEASNRRVSIIVQYLAGDGPAKAQEAKKGELSPENAAKSEAEAKPSEKSPEGKP
ncbi:MAG: OmpA family protein [Acidobacteria bacterium]|nr:OmpA family protein [Acidobacteriota bacterium]